MGKQLINLFFLFSVLVFGALQSPELSANSSNSSSDQISSEAALRVLIGEAANQGVKGMTCVGEVLRKRGSVKGFYGYNAKHIESASPSVWKQAAEAWERSAHTNYTNGADHFENVRSFGQPEWAKDFKKTFEYKDHVFYKSDLSWKK
jgi:hypothetical protein